MESNRTHSQQVHDALVKSAEAKNESLVAEKKAKRIYAQVFLDTRGTVDERKAKVATNEKYEEYEDAAIAAETNLNITRAEADGLQCRFNEWQTRESTRRAEMNLR
jgi:hypothetical protein